MITQSTRKYLARIGAIGGSKKKLSSEVAREMARLRWQTIKRKAATRGLAQ